MAGKKCTLVQHNVLIIFFTYIHVCFGCSPIPGEDGKYSPPAMEEKFFFSDVVAFGEITAIYRGEEYLYPSLYTAEMKVFCTFKGGKVAQKINITEAGYEPGLCRSNNFTVGGRYIAYMDKVGKKFRSEYGEDEGSSQLLDDVPTLCNILVEYPLGLHETNATHKCPPMEDYPDCLGYTTTKAPVEETTTKSPRIPKVPNGNPPPTPPAPDQPIVKTLAPSGKHPEPMPEDGTTDEKARAVGYDDGNGVTGKSISLAAAFVVLVAHAFM